MTAAPFYLNDDWYPLPVPSGIQVAEDVYLDSSYSFALYNSLQQPGLILGRASGVYDRAALIVGPRGQVTVGAFSVLNGTFVICDEKIDIGAHCLLSWGVVITDNYGASKASAVVRRAALVAAAADPTRHPPGVRAPRPVTLEDNVWVGFDAVILPGVRLGRGCVVGCRSVIAEDVPPYAVAVGQPARVLRYVSADDTEEARAAALRTCVHPR